MNRRPLFYIPFAIALLSVCAFATDHKHHDNLAAQAKVSQQTAQATALAKVANGIVASSELEKEHGKLIWSFDIKQRSSPNITEVQVDAITGAIVSTQIETPHDQAKEAAADKKHPD